MPLEVEANALLVMIRPALASGDVERLAQVVRARWGPRELGRLLRHSQVQVRSAAAVALGLVGSMSDVPGLARALRDGDARVVTMAEHALWSIWFRACSACAGAPFRQGVALLGSESYERAVACFDCAISADPAFAEAYHQRALAYFLLSQWGCALQDCYRAIRRLPEHFGAAAGMGHCHVHRGELSRALCCYRHALRIHPRLSGIAGAAARLEAHLRHVDHTERCVRVQMPV